MVFRSKVTIRCIFIDKYLGDGGRSALALIRILWIVVCFDVSCLVVEVDEICVTDYIVRNL